jgi:hypothetical protein
MVPTEITPFVPLTLRGRFREPPYSEDGWRDTNFLRRSLAEKAIVLLEKLNGYM